MSLILCILSFYRVLLKQNKSAPQPYPTNQTSDYSYIFLLFHPKDARLDLILVNMAAEMGIELLTEEQYKKYIVFVNVYLNNDNNFAMFSENK